MLTSNLPEEIIVDILSRVPVKSLLRFRCVCKPWLVLFSNPRFISMHLDRTAQNPNNDSLVVYSVSLYHDHVISLFRINSIDPPLTLDRPFPEIFFRMDLVGSWNGLVCLSNPPLGHMIVLWNPATKQWKAVRLSDVRPSLEDIDQVSLGFGFDPVDNDFGIIRIVCLKPRQKLLARVEVYSASADSWREVQVSFPFYVCQARCNAIVKGIPYWTAITKMAEDESQFREVLVSFDVHNEVFRQLPVLDLTRQGETGVRLVGLKDSLATIVYSPGEELNKFIEVYMLDEGCGGNECCWSKKFTVGPSMAGVVRVVQCSKNGEIVAEDTEGKLFLYDLKTKGIKNLHIDEAQALSFEAFSYTESLVWIKGMKQVGKEDKKDTTKGRKKRDDFLSEGFKLVL